MRRLSGKGSEMWLCKIMLVSIIMLFFSSCAIKNSNTDDPVLAINQRISTNNGLVSIMAPLQKNIGPFYNIHKNLEGLGIWWAIKNVMACKLIITTEKYHNFNSQKYLNKENLEIFEEEAKYKNEFYNEDFGITYKKAYVDYIDGVKCRTFVKAYLGQIYPHKINGEKTYTQQYDTYCSFYQAANSNKITNMIRIQYEYSFNRNSKAFTDSNKTAQETLNDIENIFRQDMQAIFSTIKLGIDREKMKKEGLLFDKPYKVQF